MERDAGVDLGQRLAREDLDVVTQVDQRLRQVTHVDPLAPDVGLAPVGEQGDPEASIVGRHEGVSLVCRCPTGQTAQVTAAGAPCVLTR